MACRYDFISRLEVHPFTSGPCNTKQGTLYEDALKKTII
jgi:hypothetical protein